MFETGRDRETERETERETDRNRKRLLHKETIMVYIILEASRV